MAHAWAMEAEAAERYDELAEQMLLHHNRDVAALFTRLSRIEALHRDQIAERMGWSSPPVSAAFRWGAKRASSTNDFSAAQSACILATASTPRR